MRRRPPSSTRTGPRFPAPTRFRSRIVDRGDAVAAAATGNDQRPVPGAVGALDALAADIPAADSPRPVHPEVKPFIGFDRNREFDDRGIAIDRCEGFGIGLPREKRSEEHTSELQSLMRISYAVFCLKKKTKKTNNST